MAHAFICDAIRTPVGVDPAAEPVNANGGAIALERV